MENGALIKLKIAYTSLQDICSKYKSQDSELRLTLGIAFDVKHFINVIYDESKNLESEMSSVITKGTAVSDFFASLNNIKHTLIALGLEMSNSRKFKRSTMNKIVEVMESDDIKPIQAFLTSFRTQ